MLCSSILLAASIESSRSHPKIGRSSTSSYPTLVDGSSSQTPTVSNNVSRTPRSHHAPVTCTKQTPPAFLSLGVSRIPLSLLASGFLFTMARRYQKGCLLCFLYHSAYTTVSIAFAYWRASLFVYTLTCIYKAPVSWHVT